MSCDTLNRSAVQLEVAAGSLPEGFCPSNLQDFFNAMVQRLIISPSTDFNTFVIGSTAPSSNQGPWLKDCLEWFVFDDATATYIPITKGGFDSQQYIIASTTFVVPDFIYKLKIHAWGAGGGGSNNDGAGSPGSGGGGGSYGMSIVTVIPGQSIPITVGMGGTAGAAGTTGGATTILGLTAGGGAGATSNIVSGVGGTVVGFDVNMIGQSGMANSTGSTATASANGGDAGGWGGKGGTVVSTAGAASTRVGLSPGGGGSGGSSSAASTGGAGANGAILIEW